MVTPKRIQLRRTKGWRKPEGAVVVARPSKWGNPYRWADYRGDYPDSDDSLLQRMAVSDFRGLVEGRWDRFGNTPVYPLRSAIVRELRGHDLACWCLVGSPCHADVLLELANQ